MKKVCPKHCCSTVTIQPKGRGALNTVVLDLETKGRAVKGDCSICFDTKRKTNFYKRKIERLLRMNLVIVNSLLVNSNRKNMQPACAGVQAF